MSEMWDSFLTIFFSFALLGGWTTLSHFLARHGGDPNHQIMPDELLPLDTKATSVSPRKRSSSTHTLVIPTGVMVNNGSTPTNMDPVNSSSSRNCVTPTTAYNRFINSTPVSRRSSISSPEPSIGSSSGYSSTGCNSIPMPENASGTKIPILRRKRLPSLQSNDLRNHNGLLRDSSGNTYRLTLPRSSSSIFTSDLNGNVSTSIPRSTTSTEFGLNRNRYPNYLQSSQHITNRNLGATLTPLKHPLSMQRKTAQKTF